MRLSATIMASTTSLQGPQFAPRLAILHLALLDANTYIHRTLTGTAQHAPQYSGVLRSFHPGTACVHRLLTLTPRTSPSCEIGWRLDAVDVVQMCC